MKKFKNNLKCVKTKNKWKSNKIIINSNKIIIKSNRKSIWNENRHKLTMTAIRRNLKEYNLSMKLTSFTTIPSYPAPPNHSYDEMIDELDPPPHEKIQQYVIKSFQIYEKERDNPRSRKEYFKQIHEWIEKDGYYKKNTTGYRYQVPALLEYSLDICRNEDTYGGFGDFIVKKRLPEILADGGNFAGPPGSQECWSLSRLLIHVKFYWN